MSVMESTCSGGPIVDTVIGTARPTAESALVDRVKAGDASAFEPLYRKHVGRVYALCLRMTGNETEAEEMAQDAFVRAWEKLGTFQGKSSFSTWMHRLTVNVVLSYLRSKGRRTSKVTTTDDLSRYEVEGTRQQSATRMDLDQAIQGLPKGARTVFVLHDVEGYRHDEIATKLGIATGTTKAQLHRARRLLREVLA